MKKLFLTIALVAFVASFTVPVVSASNTAKAGIEKQDKEKAKDEKKCAPGCTKPCCKDKKAECSKAKSDSCMHKKAECTKVHNDSCKHKDAKPEAK